MSLENPAATSASFAEERAWRPARLTIAVVFVIIRLFSLMGEPDAIALIELAMPYLDSLEAWGKYFA